MAFDEAKRDAFAERLFKMTIATLEAVSVYLGDRLGWYRSLAADGPATATELAERTGTNARYAREWLEHQAVAGLLIAVVMLRSRTFSKTTAYLRLASSVLDFGLFVPGIGLVISLGSVVCLLLFNLLVARRLWQLGRAACP